MKFWRKREEERKKRKTKKLQSTFELSNFLSTTMKVNTVKAKTIGVTNVADTLDTVDIDI